MHLQRDLRLTSLTVQPPLKRLAAELWWWCFPAGKSLGQALALARKRQLRALTGPPPSSMKQSALPHTSSRLSSTSTWACCSTCMQRYMAQLGSEVSPKEAPQSSSWTCERMGQVKA